MVKNNSMAKFYRVDQDEKPARWYITESEARANHGHDAKIATIEVDEVQTRLFATMWLNTSEVKRHAAIKREAAKTRDQATAIAHKVWATRRKNGTDKRKR